jgi:hypothetical protein
MLFIDLFYFKYSKVNRSIYFCFDQSTSPSRPRDQFLNTRAPHFPHFPPAPESILLNPLGPHFPTLPFSQFVVFFLHFVSIKPLFLSSSHISHRLKVQKFAFLVKFILAHQVFDKSPERRFFMEPASPPSPDSPGRPVNIYEENGSEERSMPKPILTLSVHSGKKKR